MVTQYANFFGDMIDVLMGLTKSEINLWPDVPLVSSSSAARVAIKTATAWREAGWANRYCVRYYDPFNFAENYFV